MSKTKIAGISIENPEMRKIYLDHREKVIAADERFEYLQPFPKEMVKRFWEYGLNPITGYRPVTPSADMNKKNSIKKVSEDDEE